MATFQTYQSIGNREDLTDILTNIAPLETWFTTNTGSSNCSGTYHEWQTDTLASAAANNLVEGAATSDASITPTTRAGNYTQIMGKAFKIAKTQEVIDKAGRSSEIAYQTEKHLKELAKDTEYALLFNTTAASGASGTARTLKGFVGWIATNTSTGSAADVTLTEDILNDGLQDVWAQGGSPSTLLVGAFQKRVISSFTTNTRYMVADEKKLTSAVDVYQSDFGTVTVRLHHQMNDTKADEVFIMGDMALWSKAWLRSVNRMQEPFAGDADLFAIRGECTLVSKQEKGAGRIFDLASS
jgi:hypothetical protein